MKSNRVIFNARYESGHEAYAGSVGATYGATYTERLSMKPVISNAGKQIVPAEISLISIGHTLQKGQLGARKVTTEITGNTQVISELCAEIYDLDKVLESSKFVPERLDVWLDKVMKYPVGGKELNFTEFVKLRDSFTNANKQIRVEIEGLKAASGHQKGRPMDDSLLLAIKNKMKQYTSLTGFDIRLSLDMRHEIATNDDYVICSDKDALVKARRESNYTLVGKRLVGRGSVHVVTVPIVSVDQLKAIVDHLKLGCATDRIWKSEAFCIIGSDTHNPENLDLEAARVHDRDLSRTGGTRIPLQPKLSVGKPLTDKQESGSASSTTNVERPEIEDSGTVKASEFVKGNVTT